MPDVGITGQDWIAETEADVEILATLSYAKSGTGHGTRVVLAVPNEHVANSAREIPPGTRISHCFRAGDWGLTYLAYGTREPNDMCYYPRSNKIFFRGLGLIARLEPLEYSDGEPD